MRDKIFKCLKNLRRIWQHQSDEVATKWDRRLPFADYIVDRWERARNYGFEEGSSIYDSVLVLGKVKVGKKTWIGPFCVLDGSGGLIIGDNCSISAGVQIYSHDTVEWAISGGEKEAEKKPTKIGHCCYIGPNTVIGKGVTIGDGCIVGANSLVVIDLPAGVKAFGSPCIVQSIIKE
jgi:acetyltransferase-like isoleucine patch superfamily enzyme